MNICCVFLFIMSLSVATLNTRGCFGDLKNLSVKIYVDLTLHNPDIVFLQETYKLHENSSCWEQWPYRVTCAQGDTRGTGVVTLLRNNCNFNILDSCTIFPSYVLYHKIMYASNIYHVYNVLVPQKDDLALECIDTLRAHCGERSEGFIIVGGDFNCTADPCLDRFRNNHERRSKVARVLYDFLNEISVGDAWRGQNPTKREYTWFRNDRSDEDLIISKARLDKIYISNDLFPSVLSCKIVPCAISDHCSVVINWKVSSSRRKGNSHWHFNNSLLDNKDYTDSFRIFFKQWQAEKSNFNNICTWWDIGKCKIKQLSQLFGCKNAEIKRQTARDLNAAIQHLQSAPDLSADTKKTLDEQRDALASLYTQEARGALIRARFKYVNEVDTCSSFFFGMDKSKSRAKHISQIRLPSGEITENPSEINSHIHLFYKDLYSRVDTEEEACECLLRDIPTLDPSDAKDCDRFFSLDELDVAVKQLGRDKSPGLDGLTSEFYTFFWPVLKDDILSVFNESIRAGSLPVSCRRAVVTLLPKKGDLLDIANWRPVSLLNTDYKLFAKVLANRLNCVVDQIIQPDQSYSVPGRYIYNNVNLIRDSLMYCNSNYSPLALLNLDQQKAFDNVDHEYLFKTLSAMGFGPVFISYVKLMYSGTESMIKVGGSITSPFSFEKGIRQGCPLSGLLYSIAIEPFLHTLRNRLNDTGLQSPCQQNKSIHVSAYADDITIFITKDSGFDIVEDVYNLYSKASAARLNIVKSQGLWAGSWVSREDRPLGFRWNNEGLVFLGVHLGNSNSFLQNNWQACRDKIHKCLSGWKHLSSRMSFKGRILIANQMAASKLFHVLATLSPPQNVIDELQEKLINFVWRDGRHWLNKKMLFLNQDRGGLGLTCLQARILTFRFNLLRSFLNQPDGHPCFDFISYYFRKYHNLGFDRELFTIAIDPKFFPHLPTFHSELMRAWIVLGARVSTLPSNFTYFVNLPINCSLFNELYRDGDSTVRRLMTCGIRLVKHLLDTNIGQWKSPDVYKIPNFLRISTRFLEKDLQRIQAVIISLSKDFNQKGCTRQENLQEQINDIPPPPDITILADMDGVAATTKTIYRCFTDTINDLPSSVITHWHKMGYIDELSKIHWKDIYRLPTSKKEGDIQYKLFHNILPSLQVLHHIQPDISPLCGWCGDEGNIIHLFITCPAIQTSLTLLHSILHRLLPNEILNFESYWILIPHVKGRRREVVRLCNFLIISLKSVIYWSYLKSSFTDPLTIWRNRIQYKIMSEFLYYNSLNKYSDFETKWNLDNAIFTIVDGKIIWLI